MSSERKIDPGTFCWVELSTSDAAGAKAFYTGLFGWTASDMPMGEGMTYTILEKNGKAAAAMYQAQDAAAYPAWLSYVAVVSADEMAEKAAGLGATIMAPPFDVGEAGRMALIKDGQGAVFALWQGKNSPGFGVAGENDSFCWDELSTSDAAAATKFYTGLFGWKASAMGGDGMDYTQFIREDDKGAGGMYETDKMPPMWLPYFMVADCDATAAKAQELGGRVTKEPSDIPGIGRFAFLTDPQGAGFAIIKVEAM